jgi:hypothetical protein
MMVVELVELVVVVVVMMVTNTMSVTQLELGSIGLAETS